MHLLPTQSRSFDDEAPAIDLDHTPAEVLVLSFTDSDLAIVATAWERAGGLLPSLRLVNVAKLKHPYSVDLFIEKLACRARFVLVRLLGGADYWRYGVDELGLAARREGFHLALLPGDQFGDRRLEEASTLPADDLKHLWDYFAGGGVGNAEQALRFIAARLGHGVIVAPPEPVHAAGLYQEASRPAPSKPIRAPSFPERGRRRAAPEGAERLGEDPFRHPAGATFPVPGKDDSRQAKAQAPHALILFYRSVCLAADTAPILALADALAARGARVSAFFVVSLKDPASAEALSAFLDEDGPDVILNTTAFSGRGDAGSVTDRADAPVLQVMLSYADRETWAANTRGLGPADLAMNVVLPEVDGRIIAGAISFKAEAEARPDLEFTRIVHRPDLDQIAQAADLALAWARLRHTPRSERRLACILSDYPGKDGRVGHAVGLDTPASLRLIVDHLRDEGFDIAPLPPDVMQALAAGEAPATLSIADYRAHLAALPAAFVDGVNAAWGRPEDDAACRDGAFRFPVIRAKKLIVAVQPDRGTREQRRAEYHDPTLPPRHGFVAFYLWLRHAERIHAMIHMGTHGSLEWLPGKAVALGAACAPAVLTGPTPVIYPFIVNNPGEAAQAKRRIGAVILGHLTPPLIEAGTHGDTAQLEQLFDEYAEAVTLDPRRARLLASAILAKAAESGLQSSVVINAEADPEQRLAELDAWLCDLKEMRIGDGLHVFGAAPDRTRHRLTLEAIGGTDAAAAALIDACGAAERGNLVAAVDGRFVPPGPAGAPMRGRRDVLPTGRNLFSVDPRGVPTRTAWEIGARMAEDLVTRYTQDHGDWPRYILLDLWGSATMRTGGDDLAQAFALIGAKPRWDHASTRVNGFDILPLARLGRARVDVTLRISGLFRDTFPDQIALFDAAVRAIAALDEEDAENPLAEARRQRGDLARVFGSAPGTYGIGIGRQLAADNWGTRDDLGEAYLAATSHAFGQAVAAVEAPETFRAQVAKSDAFSHTADLPGQDVLDADTFAEHEGGFAAAAALLGACPTLYRADTTRPEAVRLRTLPDDITRALLARATNPRWIEGQMRHGHAGAIGLAETLDALYGFAATTDAVPGSHFDRYFDATLGDDRVRAFLQDANPGAARAMTRTFETAIRRGFWPCLRNSTRAVLADLCGEMV